MTIARLLSWLPFASGRTDPRKKDGRGRILLWTTLVALIVGALELAEPAEDWYRMLRNTFHVDAPSGEIVVVGIDDASVNRIGVWPWRREVFAKLVDATREAGARRTFFDIIFNASGQAADDAAFLAALQRSKSVYLASTFRTDPATGRRVAKLPNPEFQRAASVVSIAINYSNLLSIRDVPYAVTLDGRTVPHIGAELAGVHQPPGKRYMIDYSIDTAKIPTYSAADVIQGKVGRRELAGKDVVVAIDSRELGDLYFAPGRGIINGGFLMVTAAETLKRGAPLYVGWALPLIGGFLLSLIHLYARRRWIGRAALFLAICGVSVVPLLAEINLVFFDVMPMLLLIGTVAGSRAWANFRQSYKVRGNINSISGLPNLNALRGENVLDDAVLVAARVRNFAEISSALPLDSERALVEQIVARLALGARGARIYQGDEGIFVWVATPDSAGPDQLDALHALFRSPALLDGRPVDLSVTFGTDAGGDRSLANRIGATLVAADEAAVEGLRWKAYDPAKLADAEWKLSLLGRLDAAIDSGEIWVAYQPQLELATGRICGAEALVRWSHPEKGEVSPQEFVLAAEQHDRIDKLTEFVLSEAIRAAAAFAARGINLEVAVNISARLLEKPGLVALVRGLLAQSALPHDRLTLEVTESAAMASGRTSIRTLEEIGSLGINVSIDDYGTGFSTLDYFKRIPATEVKIDRSFVAAIDRNASDRVMVRSTIELAHSLGRTVVAEGVESAEILSELRKLGCDRAQGYLIGRPMKLMNLTKLLLAANRTRAA